MAQKKKQPIQTNPENRPFLSLMPPGIAKLFLPVFRPFAMVAMRFIPGFTKEFKKTGATVSAVEYLATGLSTYSFLGFLIGFVIYFVLANANSRQVTITESQALVVGLLLWFVITLLLLYLAMKHPTSASQYKAKVIDQTLLYSLRDLSLQLNTGNTTFQSMSAVADAEYAGSSKEFETIVKKLNVGLPLEKVLREQITLTDSEYLRKTYWQLLNSIHSGSDLKQGLKTIIGELDSKQKNDIQNYARELGLWSIVYMMFAVAVPTIGTTMLVILSAFAGGGGIEEPTFIMFLVVSFIIQIGLIMFVKSRRPMVQF